MQHCMQISAAVQADSAKIIMMHVVDLGEAIFKKILLFYNSETSYFKFTGKKVREMFPAKNSWKNLPYTFHFTREILRLVTKNRNEVI